MKFNWINVLATLLILTGIYLLVAKKQPSRELAGSTTRPMTDEEVRNHFYATFEKTLGRPLNDVEKQMITINRDGTSAQARLAEPLLSRVAMAERQRKAMQASGTGTNLSPTEPGNILPPATTAPALPTVR